MTADILLELATLFSCEAEAHRYGVNTSKPEHCVAPMPNVSESARLRRIATLLGQQGLKKRTAETIAARRKRFGLDR